MVTSRLGDFWGRVFLADVVLAAFVCTLAIQTATTRMIYSMSRDEVLPFSASAAQGLPRGATVATPRSWSACGAAVLLLINLGHAGVFTALTSTCIVLLYLAYLCVTGSDALPPAQGLAHRARDRRTTSWASRCSASAGWDCRSTCWLWSGDWRWRSTSPGRARRSTTPRARIRCCSTSG